MSSMWVKICGVRDVITALGVAQFGADAIGLNFYEPSPRSVPVEMAEKIISRLPPGVEPVGLFVNAPVELILERCQVLGLRTVQLHGDETPEMLSRLRGLRVIRAFRVGDDGLGEMYAYLRECQSLGALPWACLVDAKVAGAYGGTGHRAPWELLREYDQTAWPRLILAGGLTPVNVAEAVQTVRPWGVDVAGGVESAVACKDLMLVRQFIQNGKQSELE